MLSPSTSSIKTFYVAEIYLRHRTSTKVTYIVISCYVTRSFIRGIICEGSFATWNMRVRLHLDSPPISMMTDHVISTFFTVSCVFWAKHIFQSFIHRVIMEHILFTIQCIRIYRNLECQRWLWKIKNYCCLFSFAFPRLDSVKKNWRFCFCSTQKNGTNGIFLGSPGWCQPHDLQNADM